MDKQSVRQFFRSVIEESGISFAELSKKIGITKTELLKYANDENVSIPVDVIAKVAIETKSPGLCYLVTTYEIERAEMWRNIKRLIKERGITQKRFLEDICLLSSDCKSGPLQQVADYFGVTTDYLLGHEQSEEEPTTREEETQMKTQAKPTIDEIIESMSEMGQVEWSYLRSAMDSKFTAPREVSDESRKQHEKKLERLFNALCESVERISEGKIAAPDETKILPDLIRILKHWDND